MPETAACVTDHGQSSDSATQTCVTVTTPCATDEAVNPSRARRAVAVAAALVPGIIINGTGHWVTGQTCTARRLLMAEGVGLLGMGVGIPVIALAGAPRYLTTPAIVLTLGGFAMILTAIGADVYGASGTWKNPGEPMRRRSRWETELGVLHVYNPHFDFGWLLTQRAAANVGRTRISAGLDATLDGVHAHYRLGAALRLLGPTPNSTSPDGSFFDVAFSTFEQRFTSMGFVTAGAEIIGAGRLDLGRVGPTLRGSFAEVSIGLQASHTSYRIVGMSVDSDDETLLLSRLAFGVYLGRGSHRGSEAKFYYDHRRDDYAAGIKVARLRQRHGGPRRHSGSILPYESAGVRCLTRNRLLSCDWGFHAFSRRRLTVHRSSPVAIKRQNAPAQTSHELVQNTGTQGVCSNQTARTERAAKRTAAALSNHHRSRKACHCTRRANTGMPSSRTKGNRSALVRLNYVLGATLLLLVLGCTDVADDRAERDERVGHFHDSQLRLDVDDGLAAIRSATGDRFVLWSGAPVWSATLRTASPRALELELRNIVPGSALLASTEGGSPLRVTLTDEPLPTQRHFVVAAHQGDIRLTLVPPGAHDAAPFRFAVLSDIQSAVTRVQSIFERLNAEREVSFVLSVGDLTDRGKREQLERFETELRELSIPFYSTLGNHELFGGTPPFQEVFGRASFHFHFRDTAFSLVDSGSATLAPKVEAWLDQWLAEDRSRTHVFATHIPPIDPIGTRGGAFTSKLEARQLIANLAEGKVDLAVYGHIHSYYEFTTAGVRSYISGGGGGRPELLDGIERHYLLVNVGTTGITSVSMVEVD